MRLSKTIFLQSDAGMIRIMEVVMSGLLQISEGRKTIPIVAVS